MIYVRDSESLEWRKGVSYQADTADVAVVTLGMFPHWFAWLALGLFVFLLVVPWLQRAFGLTQCPGSDRGELRRQWDGPALGRLLSNWLCIGFVWSRCNELRWSSLIE